ncbi:gliding motility-associated peptidyl-prolyl isomerase GldI [Bacteroidota bacterium]|jgi:gliding motility-associated peptidyl-prolyl isomerase
MKNFLYVLPIVFLIACGETEPRRPVKTKSGSLINASVQRNIELLNQEEQVIKQIIANDTLHHYLASATGSWYFYSAINEESDYTPLSDDLVTLSYNLVSLENDTIYSMEEIGIIKYKVDKQELFPGLRSSVKLLKENETATFFFPSAMAYGYHGDNNKIGPNVALKSTIRILKIDKQKENIDN